MINYKWKLVKYHMVSKIIYLRWRAAKNLYFVSLKNGHTYVDFLRVLKS